jgi:hypothetical protein
VGTYVIIRTSPLTKLTMELSTPWEAITYVTIRYFPSTFLSAKVYYRIHKSSPPVSILSHINQVHTTPSHPISTKSILILSTRLRLGLPSGLFPSGFPTNNLHAVLLSPFRAPCPAHLILHSIILIILDKKYKSRSSSLCSFSAFPSPRLSSVQILSSAPCSQTPLFETSEDRSFC